MQIEQATGWAAAPGLDCVPVLGCFWRTGHSGLLLTLSLLAHLAVLGPERLRLGRVCASVRAQQASAATRLECSRARAPANVRSRTRLGVF